MKVRVLFANCLLVIVSTSFSLVLFEVAVRKFFPIYDPSGYVSFTSLADGTVVGHRGAVLRQVKNTGDYDVEVRFNDWGLRDEKILTTAKPNDLFVVGDSFAFGWGVDIDDRFSNQLQAILNRPVFNIANGGTDLDGYSRLIRYVERSGVSIKNLIVAVTMENDIHLYGKSSLASSFESGGSHGVNFHSIKAQLAVHSALYHLITHIIHRNAWFNNIAVQLGIIVPNLEAIPGENISNEALSSSALRVFQLSRGRNVTVLIIPSRQLWVGEAERRLEANRVHLTFVGILRTAGLHVVDIRSRFEARGNPLSNHFANDGHWNKMGHRMAAEALAETLQRWD